MTQPDFKELVRQTPFSFIGTVEILGGAMSSELPIDDHTGVARVDLVLHAPVAFEGLVGHGITVQFSPDENLPVVGEQLVLFAEGLAFGETVAVSEVGRMSVDAVGPFIREGIESGRRRVLEPLEREIAAEALRDHAYSADAVVVGSVTSLEQASEPGGSEHDPQWWRATIDVRNTVRGNVELGSVSVLYPSSRDVVWARVPKPRASDYALWILHRSEDEAESDAYRLLHPEDRQPVDALAIIEGR